MMIGSGRCGDRPFQESRSRSGLGSDPTWDGMQGGELTVTIPNRLYRKLFPRPVLASVCTSLIARCSNSPRFKSSSSATRSSESSVGFDSGRPSKRLSVDWFNPDWAARRLRDRPRRCRSSLSNRRIPLMIAARRSALVTLADYTETAVDMDMHICIVLSKNALAHILPLRL